MSFIGLHAKSALPLCAVAVVLFAMAYSPRTKAAILEVTNCADAGPGSLRHTVAIAASDDTLNLKHLQCSAIVLTSGQILIPQANLTLVGRRALTVDGNRNDRVFQHSGTGTLRIESLSLANGHRVDSYADGGCVQSMGRVEFIRSDLHHCVAESTGGVESILARGGGLFATTGVLLSHSRVFTNAAIPAGAGGGLFSNGHIRIYASHVSDNETEDGGAIAGGAASIVYSHIDGNHAYGWGGAMVLGGSVTINKSTISNNHADDYAGAIWLLNSERLLILDSTISGNSATRSSVGYLADVTTISNSTIAFNQEQATEQCQGALQAFQLHLESSILSNNTCAAGSGQDIGGVQEYGYTVVGKDNLVGRSALPLPADTIVADPRLAPLADNGGPTPTHALRLGSPAINAGNNVLNRLYDQRGPGFPRTCGQRPDVGATEYCWRTARYRDGVPH